MSLLIGPDEANLKKVDEVGVAIYSITTYLTHSFVYIVHPCTIKNILFTFMYWIVRGYSLFFYSTPSLGILSPTHCYSYNLSVIFSHDHICTLFNKLCN